MMAVVVVLCLLGRVSPETEVVEEVGEVSVEREHEQ